MKNLPLLLFLTISLLISCKSETHNKVTKIDQKVAPSAVSKTNEEVDYKNKDCYEFLTELVRSSDFPFREIKKDKVNLLIDDDNGKVISAKLFFDADGTGTIGWIEYNIKQRKLFNTSADVEAPKELKFDINFGLKFQKCLSEKK